MGFGFSISCAGENTAPASTETNLVGDWILCEDEACSLLADDGQRFAEDGTATELDSADGPAVEPVSVCLGVGTRSYRVENDTLIFGDATVRFTLSGNILTLYDVPYMVSDGTSGTQTLRMLRVATIMSDSCANNQPPPPQGP